MSDDKLEKAVYRKWEKEQKEKKAAREKRAKMLIRLGVVADQMMKRGDPAFIDRFEAEARNCFPDEDRYSADRAALGLDGEFAVFDGYRAERGLPPRLNATPKATEPHSVAASSGGAGRALRSMQPSASASSSESATPASSVSAAGGT